MRVCDRAVQWRGSLEGLVLVIGVYGQVLLYFELGWGTDR